MDMVMKFILGCFDAVERRLVKVASATFIWRLGFLFFVLLD